MDGHTHYQSDFSSMDDELQHLYNPRDATAEDCLEDEDIRGLNEEAGNIDLQLAWYHQPQYSRYQLKHSHQASRGCEYYYLNYSLVIKARSLYKHPQYCCFQV